MPPRYVPDGSSASGGFGDVLYCNDTHLLRKVAIKTIKKLSELPRLKDEISALLKLRSKHVVQVFDIVESDDDDSFAIVMEFIDGLDLFNGHFTRLDSTSLLKLLWQISTGIADIHAAGVIHRDIKPNNMKLDGEGILKIFDFGLARNTGKEAKTVGFKGTLGFSAPEQFTDNEVAFTPAIDVYAFGALTLYLVTQTLPKELTSIPPAPLGSNVFDIRILQEYPDLVALLIACLSHPPELRPKISAVRDLLAKHLLFDEHQALAVINGQTHLINKNKRTVKLGFGGIGSFELHYDGLSYHLKNAVGEVYLNNIYVNSDRKIPGSCVVGIGNAKRHFSERSFITFDVSNPEVTL
jgi:serine/threonine protein kinase